MSGSKGNSKRNSHKKDGTSKMCDWQTVKLSALLEGAMIVSSVNDDNSVFDAAAELVLGG